MREQQLISQPAQAAAHHLDQHQGARSCRVSRTTAQPVFTRKKVGASTAISRCGWPIRRLSQRDGACREGKPPATKPPPSTSDRKAMGAETSRRISRRRAPTATITDIHGAAQHPLCRRPSTAPTFSAGGRGEPGMASGRSSTLPEAALHLARRRAWKAIAAEAATTTDARMGAPQGRQRHFTPGEVPRAVKVHSGAPCGIHLAGRLCS